MSRLRLQTSFAPMRVHRILLVAAAVIIWSHPAFATFSIIARDPATGEMGIAVASRVLAVRMQVGWAEPGVGIVARQADLNLLYGPRAIELLEKGLAAQQVIEQLLREHPSSAHQIAIIDAQGHVAVSTGPDALDWKGHKKGNDYSVQGNVLVGPKVIEGMADAFEKSTGPLAERLFAALKAGDDVGGDRRGRQSAYLLVVKKNGGFGTGNDHVVDVSVDDHPNPVPELRRLLNVQLAWNAESDAFAALEAGEVERAGRLAAQAAALAPDNSYMHIALGFITYVAGRRDEALTHFQKARRMDPRFSEVWDTYKGGPLLKRVFEDREFVDKVFGPSK
jgi:uncharacterized Ntn-hydrolase superfamily protein